MAIKRIKQTVQDLLIQADVKTDGKRPWDIQVNNQDFYPKILTGGSLALGESYMDGWWECEALDQFIDRLLRLGLDTKFESIKRFVWNTIKARIINQQRKSKAHVVGERHYDKTLMAWHKNFNENWDKIKIYYDERFHRMWNYYLLSSAGAFRAYNNQLWQIVFSKLGSLVKYESIR